MRRRALIVLGALALVAGAFWLKVEHAVGICREAGGRWADGDCLFEERPAAREGESGASAVPGRSASR